MYIYTYTYTYTYIRIVCLIVLFTGAEGLPAYTALFMEAGASLALFMHDELQEKEEGLAVLRETFNRAVGCLDTAAAAGAEEAEGAETAAEGGGEAAKAAAAAAKAAKAAKAAAARGDDKSFAAATKTLKTIIKLLSWWSASPRHVLFSPLAA